MPLDASLIAETVAMEALYDCLRGRGVQLSLRFVDELPSRDYGKFRLYVPWRETARPTA